MKTQAHTHTRVKSNLYSKTGYDLEHLKTENPIPDAWQRLGLEGRPAAGKVLSSPFREDRNPSFSISACGKLWKDHGTDESGDVFTFVEKATGRTFREALDWLGGGGAGHTRTPRPGPPRTDPEPTERKTFSPPQMDNGTIADMRAIAKSREFNVFAGAEILRHRGILRFCKYSGRRAWVLFDPAGPSCQCRTITGEPFPNGSKTGFYRGVNGRWPCGTSMMRDHVSVVYIVEGQPDALAAATFHWTDGPFDVVAMFGASQDIDPRARPLFKGKSVTIYAHHDPGAGPGLRAARRWRKQLQPFAASVEIRIPDTPGDLSDYVANLNREERNQWN